MVGYIKNDQVNVCTLLVVMNLLLGDVLESLLSNISTLQIHRMMCVNFAGLLQGISQHQPEVIVLEEGVMGESDHPLLSQLLHDGRTRVIIINPEENLVHVYDKFSVTLTQSADLIDLIENFSPPNGVEPLKLKQTV